MCIRKATIYFVLPRSQGKSDCMEDITYATWLSKCPSKSCLAATDLSGGHFHVVPDAETTLWPEEHQILWSCVRAPDSPGVGNSHLHFTEQVTKRLRCSKWHSSLWQGWNKNPICLPPRRFCPGLLAHTSKDASNEGNNVSKSCWTNQVLGSLSRRYFCQIHPIYKKM